LINLFLNYMIIIAPEIVTGEVTEAKDHSCSMWSIGVIMYCLYVC
jgi:serine/threonine protein kinase